MSIHLMTVYTDEGTAVQLRTGYDRRLRQFFLSLRDKRLPAPGTGAAAAAEAATADLLSYDSLGDGLELGRMGSIGDVEDRLYWNGIPFDPEVEPHAERNPKLLKLLVEVMREKEDDDPDSGRKVKDWDALATAA